MPDSLIKSIVDTYRTLTSTSNAYYGERSGDMALPCLVFRPYGGTASPTLPTQDWRIQVTAYATTEEGAHTAAEAVRTALHQRDHWDVGSYVVHYIVCDPVVTLPPQPATGGSTYLAAVSMRLHINAE